MKKTNQTKNEMKIEEELTMADFIAYKEVMEGILKATGQKSKSKSMIESLCRMDFGQWVEFQKGGVLWN